MTKDVSIHPSSYVDEGAIIGAGTKIWHFCHIVSSAVVGENCTIGQNVFIGNAVKIGAGVKIQNNVSIYDGVELEDGVFCGPSLVFTNVKNPRAPFPVKNKAAFAKTLVKKGATLGANATIVCGIEIGQWAFVAAGSVVTKTIKDYALVAGVPARQIGWACLCGMQLPETTSAGKLSCAHCERTFSFDGAHLTMVSNA